jgi:hypothetical protein
MNPLSKILRHFKLNVLRFDLRIGQILLWFKGLELREGFLFILKLVGLLGDCYGLMDLTLALEIF